MELGGSGTTYRTLLPMERGRLGTFTITVGNTACLLQREPKAKVRPRPGKEAPEQIHPGSVSAAWPKGLLSALCPLLPAHLLAKPSWKSFSFCCVLLLL